MTLNFEFPWQDLLTLPLPPELEQVEGDYVGHRLLRETMLEASTRAGPLPGDPERDYPGGLAEFCQDLTLRGSTRGRLVLQG